MEQSKIPSSLRNQGGSARRHFADSLKLLKTNFVKEFDLTSFKFTAIKTNVF